MDMGFSYNFPAIRGKQAGKEYFVAMCPLRIIPKIFLFDEDEIPPEHRAQRILNKTRIPEMTNYIVENQDDYVFSSITASIDGELEFIPFGQDTTSNDLGQLRISLEARFLINDGQHRRAAIEEALKIAPELGNETISVVFFYDEGLKNSQQIFSDLNRHAVNTTSSIGILYDHRDRLAMLTKEIVAENPLLSRYTDREKVSLSKNSPKIMALNHIFNTNLKLVGKTKGDVITDDEEQFVKEFWSILCETITEWQLVLDKQMNPRELRMNYIVGHGLFLEAVGIVGRYAYEFQPTSWQETIRKLSTIDWNRANTTDWEGRAFNSNGRIQKNNHTIQLTANLIKEKLGLPLTENEMKIENKFKSGESNDK
ncbi:MULTISPECIES: DNA sulfur modification protein DndB [Bacillales]|uniref:DNA sulfur modification protein DndB n=1 Tax=Bacillales TaxID=1385 RepID=UPI001CFC559F|nr:DNA sulfur modification protein DndB [Pseudalkalibacillus hwajinpoensis]WLR59116.1 DNA sulfur modification protein DndB [Pseudalkalibacillus hwajinpoensis]